MPCVIECAKKVFKQDPISTVNVDEVVALGACLYAAHKSDGANLSEIQKKSIAKLKVQEVTNAYFGTIAVGVSESKGEDLQNSILIKKGQTIPCSVTETYYTIYEGQEAIRCRITESKSPEIDPRFVKIVHDEELPLPPNRPAGQELKITYKYDENQMMHAKFRDVSSGRETSVKISMAKTNASAHPEIDKFLVE